MSQTTTGTDQLMTIGAFARRSRLSLKALRLYDELELLRPATVDEWTSYRYYREDQLERARLIGLLRRLDMPLERIAQVLELGAPEQVDEIGRFWREVEGSVAVKRRLVAYLERYLEGRGDTMYEVRTRQVPEQQVLTVSRNVRQPELQPFLMEAMSDLPRALEGTRAKTDSHCFAIYHGVVSADSDGPVEVCLPFEGQIEAPAGTRIRIEPAHNEAFTTITLAQCVFPGILEAYDAVSSFIDRQGMEPIGSPREVYFVEHEKVAENDPFCDIAWPASPARKGAAVTV
jgi:DNA-binding transcriptional MerR regulator